MLSYLVGRRIKQGVLVYPADEVDEKLLSIEAGGETYSIYVKTIDLANIDDAAIQHFAEEVTGLVDWQARISRGQ
jgi:hypothetical protein